MERDAELLQRWRAGDKTAGDVLLQRYFAGIHRFFRTKLGDDVDDLVQQVFLGCVESRDRVEDGEFRAYLYGIARHRLCDRLRMRLSVDLEVDSIADCGTTPSKRVARREDERLLLSAMRHIPINAQVVLELTYWEGMSGKEVARVLGISEHTVRSRLARARDELRKRIRTTSPATDLSRVEWLDGKV